MKKEKEVYKTIRIYKIDHDKLIKEFSKEKSFAEIIHLIIYKNKSGENKE